MSSSTSTAHAPVPDEGLSDLERYKMKCRVLKEKVRMLERELTLHRTEAIKRQALEKQQKKMEDHPLDAAGKLARRGGELKEIGGRLIDSLDDIVRRQEQENTEVRNCLTRLHEKEEQIFDLVMEHARLRVIPLPPPPPPPKIRNAAPTTIAATVAATAVKVTNIAVSPGATAGKPLAGAVAAAESATTSSVSSTISSTACDMRNDEALRNAELALAAFKEAKDEEVRIAQEALERERDKIESLQNLVRSLERGIREEKVKLVELKFRLQREKIPMPGHLLQLLQSNRARGAQTQAALVSRGIVLEDTLSSSTPSSSPTLLAPSSYPGSTLAVSPVTLGSPRTLNVVVPALRTERQDQVGSSGEGPSPERRPTSSAAGDGKWVRKQSSRESRAVKIETSEAVEPAQESAPAAGLTLGGRRTLLSAGRQGE